MDERDKDFVRGDKWPPDVLERFNQQMIQTNVPFQQFPPLPKTTLPTCPSIVISRNHDGCGSPVIEGIFANPQDATDFANAIRSASGENKDFTVYHGDRFKAGLGGWLWKDPR